MAIPARPSLPSFLNPIDAAPAVPVVPAVPAAAVPGSPVPPGSSRPFRLNKPRVFSAEDLEASYARQQARRKAFPNWLNRVIADPNPYRVSAGLLPTLPPGQQFPLLQSLLNPNGT